MRPLIVIIALTACGGEAVRPPLQHTNPERPALSDPLALMPAESDIVLTLDLAALRRSPLWAKYKGFVYESLTPAFVGCNYNPLDEITTITAGIPMDAKLGVFVVRGLDRDKTLRCLRESKIQTNTTASFDGEYVTLLNKSGNSNIFTFVDARTLVMQGSTGPTKETLRQALTIGAPLRADRAFVAARDRLAPGAAMSVVARPGSEPFRVGMQARLGAPARGFTTTVHVSDRLAVHVAVELDDDATATEIAATIKPQIADLENYVDRYDVKAVANLVVADVVMSEAQIQFFVDLAKTQMGTAPSVYTPSP